MSIQLRKVIDGLKLPKDAKEQAEQLLDLPEVKTALARAEYEELRARAELIRKWEDVPRHHVKAKERAAKAAHDARKELDEAEAAVLKAKAKYQAALAAVLAAEGAERDELGRLEKEIRDGRDRRLDDYWLELDRLEQQARCLLEVWPEHHKAGPFGIPQMVYKSNGEDVEAAQIALKGLKQSIEDMSMLSISSEKVTKMLTAFSESLAISLAPLQLCPPRIDENGFVQPPKRAPGADDIKARIEKAAA